MEHRGGLLRVSPEEITSAVTLAIARDIANHEADTVLAEWKRVVRSTTCTFKLLATSSDRYWYALQQRENTSTTHAVVHRTTFQRVHEIHRLMRRLKETRPAAEVTSQAIAVAMRKT